MGRSARTRAATRGDSKLYAGKAAEFLSAMERAIASGEWDAAGLAAIHSGISATDAVLAYHGGVRSAGQDHRVAVDMLRETMGGASSEPAKHLKRLIDKKNLVEYEQRRLTHAEALDLAEHARRFLKWAKAQLP